MPGVRDVVEVLAKALTDRPDDVRVTESQHRHKTLIELFVAPAAASGAGAASGFGVRCRAMSVRTESDGCAPFLIQYSTRSLSMFTSAGFVRGL